MVGKDAPDAIAAIASIDLSPSGVRRTLCQSLCDSVRWSLGTVSNGVWLYALSHVMTYNHVCRNMPTKSCRMAAQNLTLAVMGRNMLASLRVVYETFIRS